MKRCIHTRYFCFSKEKETALGVTFIYFVEALDIHHAYTVLSRLIGDRIKMFTSWSDAHYSEYQIGDLYITDCLQGKIPEKDHSVQRQDIVIISMIQHGCDIIGHQQSTEYIDLGKLRKKVAHLPKQDNLFFTLMDSILKPEVFI